MEHFRRKFKRVRNLGCRNSIMRSKSSHSSPKLPASYTTLATTTYNFTSILAEKLYILWWLRWEKKWGCRAKIHYDYVRNCVRATSWVEVDEWQSLYSSLRCRRFLGSREYQNSLGLWCTCQKGQPFISSKNSHFQNEAKCRIFLVKMSLFSWQ